MKTGIIAGLNIQADTYHTNLQLVKNLRNLLDSEEWLYDYYTSKNEDTFTLKTRYGISIVVSEGIYTVSQNGKDIIQNFKLSEVWKVIENLD